MSRTTDLPLLMHQTLAELRAKLLAPTGHLASLWENFLARSRDDAAWFSPYAVLAALVTQDAGDRERARAAVLRFVALKAEGDTSLEAQFHTHVTSAAVGRWAVYYDWLAGEGVFTAAEEAAIQEALVDHAWVFAQQHLESRAQFFDNQIMANAFAAATIGYVCGVRRGQSATARQLYASGMQRLESIYRHLTPSGYSLEGSTYHLDVVTPLVGLTGCLLEQLTGRNVFREGVPGSGVPLRNTLELSWRMIGPGGLAPGWDAYGFQPAAIKSGLALLADLDGDARPLRTLAEAGMWYRNCLPAWDHDDRLWTLVWWPAGDAQRVDSGVVDHFAGSWMSPTIGGALHDTISRARLMQVWDECGGVPSSGRCQVDPNAVTLEAHGSVLLVDGLGKKLPAELLPMPRAEILAYAGREPFQSLCDYFNATWGGDRQAEAAIEGGMDGSVGLSNALVFDDEGWYVPLAPVEGVGEVRHQSRYLQVLRGDATAYYTDRYDVTQVTRSSLLLPISDESPSQFIRDDTPMLALTCDRVTSATPHAATWQAFLRREATLTADGATILSPEQVQCDVHFMQDGAASLADAPGYPTAFAGGSQRLQQRLAPATEHRIDVAMVTQPRLKIVALLAHEWAWSLVTADGEVQDETVDPVLVDLRHFWKSDTVDRPGLRHRFARRLDLPADATGRLWLSLDVAHPEAELRVNGTLVPPSERPVGKGYFKTGNMLANHYDITDALRRDGAAEHLEILTPSFHGESVRGMVRLLREVPAAPVACRREGPDALVFDYQGTSTHVLLDRDRSAGTTRWLDGETDARYAVAYPRSTTLMGVQQFSAPSFVNAKVSADAPCDLSLVGTALEIHAIPDGATLSISVYAGELRIEMGPCVQLTWRGESTDINSWPCLVLPVSPDRPVRLNGKPIDGAALSDGTMVFNLDGSARNVGDSCSPAPTFPKSAAPTAESVATFLTPVAEPVPAPALGGVEALYRAAETEGRGAAPAILAALDSADWRLQLAGADLAGRLELTEAGDRLLAIFAREAADLPYPQLTKWWSWSRMMRGGQRDEGIDPDLPLPLGIKRWRVRRAAVTALGLVGERRAIQPLAAALERCKDFFPVTSHIPVALARLEAKECLPLLVHNRNHGEANTRRHCRDAAAYLSGEIDREAFEMRIGKA